MGAVVIGFNVVGWNEKGEPVEGSLAYRVCPHCGWGDWDMVLPCPRCGYDVPEENRD
jgi:hypothetical protein